MNRRYLKNFVDVDKIAGKEEKKDEFSFFEGLDLLDFRDDIEYK